MTLEETRALLTGSGDRYRWSALCEFLTEARRKDPVFTDEVLLPEVAGALARWPDDIKISPPDWTMRYFDPSDADPLLGLPRVLRYRSRADYRLRDRQQISLSPQARSLHTLDIRVDYVHAAQLPRVIEALGEVARIETLEVEDPGSARMEQWREAPLVEGALALRIGKGWDLKGCLPLRARLQELALPNHSELPERDWLLGLRRLFGGKESIALARRIEGLEGLTVCGPLASLFEGSPRWNLKEIRFGRPIDEDDVACLASMPALAAIERIEGQASMPVASLFFDMKSEGKLPALRKATLRRNIYLFDDDLVENFDTPSARYASIFEDPIEQSVLEAVDERTLVWRELAIGPYDLLEHSDEDYTLAPDKLDQILARTASNPPQTLRVTSPDPEITDRLLSWPKLPEVRDLVLVCDTLNEGDWPEALSTPYRVDDQDLKKLASSEALSKIERLHLAFSLNRDDRFRKKRLSSLPSLPRLYSLDLGDGEILSEDLEKLLDSSLLQGIVRLRLAGNPCTNVSEIFSRDDDQLSRLEYLDLRSLSGYDTTGSMKMTYPLRSATRFRRLSTLLLEHSAKTEFGEEADPYTEREELPSLDEITTSYYYIEAFE